MTRSLYQALYFELTCAPKHALPHHVFRGARRQSVKIGFSKSKRINVAGQGQPKHLHIQPHGQYQRLKRSVSDLKRPTVRKYINEKPETAALIVWYSCDPTLSMLYTVAILHYRFLSCWCLETFFK